MQRKPADQLQTMSNPLFYAKILLFGEYGIIEDSQGLTLPYSFYKGTLKFSDLKTDFEKKSNLKLAIPEI